MRIMKDRAVSLLKRECNMLTQQRTQCMQQVVKLMSFSLGGISGLTGNAIQSQARMQANVAKAHQYFYEELLKANQRNIQLVQALPTTSPGVLDTNVAQQNIDKARNQIRSLEQRREREVAQAYRLSEQAAKVPSRRPDEARGSALISAGVIKNRYHQLIYSQKAIIYANQQILEKAEQYDHESLVLYRSVNVAHLRNAVTSANSFMKTGSWGSTGWVHNLTLAMAASSLYKAVNELYDLGDAVANGKTLVETEGFSETPVIAMNSTAPASADPEVREGMQWGGYSFTVKPYNKRGMDQKEVKKGEKDHETKSLEWQQNASRGIKAEGDAYVFRYTESQKEDWTKHDLNIDVGTLAASGTMGASLYKDGKFNPKIEAKVNAEVAAVSAETSRQFGTDQINVHGKAEGKLLGGELKGEFSYSEDGIKVEAGAEAYLAKGELSTGFTLFGVKFDLTAEGTIGSLGGKAGAAVGKDSAEGELAFAFLGGVGLKAKVDWSGFDPKIELPLPDIGEWWAISHVTY